MEIRKSTICASKGLFATTKIPKGAIFLIIHNPFQTNEDDVQQKGFPKDSVIFFKHKPLRGRKITLCIFDSDWTNPEIPPWWYYQNHGTDTANSLLCRYCNEKGLPTVCWQAKRNIEPNEEILFNYQPGVTLKFSQ